MLRRTALGLLAGNALAAGHLMARSSHAGLTAATPDPVEYPYPGYRVEFGQSASAPLFVVIPPSGGDDTSAIQGALDQGISVQLLPGDYHINTTLTVGQVVNSTTQLPANNGTMLAGCGQATQLIPTASFAAIVTLTPGGTLRDLAFYGGNSTVTAANPNPAVDAISVSVPAISSSATRQTSPAVATNIFIENIYATYVNGWILNPQTITKALHLSVKGVRGIYNAGGIRLVGNFDNTLSTGTTAQVALTDIDMQRCQTNPALYLENVEDVSVNWLNCAVDGSTTNASTVELVGYVATALFSGVDAGVYPQLSPQPSPPVPVMRIKPNTYNNVTVGATDVTFTGCAFQAGGIGVEVDGACDRIRFANVMAKHNASDGWRFTSHGTFISLTGCGGLGNGGYDVNVTGSMHVGLFGFGYCSSSGAGSLNIPSSNHVTNDNPTYPGGKPSAGKPEGW